MNFQTILLSTLGTILTALATWGVERLIAWLNTKIKDQKALTYLNNAISVVTSVVKATYQTYVEALKNENMFTKEAQEQALNKAVEQAKATMSAEVKNFITENYGDLTEWIKLQIESAIYSLKNGSQEV